MVVLSGRLERERVEKAAAKKDPVRAFIKVGPSSALPAAHPGPTHATARTSTFYSLLVSGVWCRVFGAWCRVSGVRTAC